MSKSFEKIFDYILVESYKHNKKQPTEEQVKKQIDYMVKKGWIKQK